MTVNGNGVFTIDGIDYRIEVMELKRGFKVTDTEHSDRTQDYAMHRDIIGTFYNYTISAKPDPSHRNDYDSFYDVVSSPVESHIMVFPFGRETLEFKAYVTSGEDTYTAVKENGMWINRWDGMSLNFIAMEPQRRP